jgi:RND family efflux transporter MFP subunit
MTRASHVQMRRSVLIIAAAGLLAVGAGATYLILQKRAPGASPTHVSPPAETIPASGIGAISSNEPLPDVTVTLSDEAVQRAGIEITPVTTAGSGGIRVPAVVQPNAYRSVVVTPIAAGRITRVLVELGQEVRRGHTLAEVYSPELAEAQTRYVSSRAELEAHERELRRTEKLVEIGAASRQELERIHAEHTAATTMVQSNRSRLILLGMTEGQAAKLTSASAITATTTIAAPIDGVITAREANVGLNIDPATKLFTVVDLSTVWLVGDLYERDFTRVHVGSKATVTTTAYPGLAIEGKVSYIDPELKAETRTAQLRVEVPNPGRQLRLGMYAELQIGEPVASNIAAVPRAAVQTVGDRSVVYLVSDTQRRQFVEREVQLGQPSDGLVEITRGVQPGDSVVSKGSFAIRAERERLGLRPPSQSAPQSASAGQAAAPSQSTPQPASARQAPHAGATQQNVQTARVTVSDKGFEPNRVTVRAGVPARITFVRTVEATCATEVTLPAMKIKRPLPLNQPVDVEFTPEKTGDIEFACGMNMLKGTIVIK